MSGRFSSLLAKDLGSLGWHMHTEQFLLGALWRVFIVHFPFSTDSPALLSQIISQDENFALRNRVYYN
jgi:hypothetical protein